jgi:serine/threonine protein phosphatase PrpC/CRP-like cAMP-binding protein
MYRHITRAKAKESKLRRMNPSMKEDEFLKKMELTKEQIQAAALKSHMDCNKAMHRSSKFDDSLSGTTSISALLSGRRNRITVSNVGDSRAILGQRVISGKPPPGGGPPSSSLRAVPLSRDQTPYRRDERIRIRATGARILSLDQIEGFEPINDEEDDDASQNGGDLILGEEIDEGGDPPRVWSPHGEYPGTAFSRSFGDAIAEELGVFAEPEMITRELTPDDEIIVLASDGVFEFLTNQSVIDICAKFNDPLQACRAVVAESYELWLQYELRTDDITMICIFVDEVTPKAGGDFFALSNRNFAEKVNSSKLETSMKNVVIIDDEGGDDTLDAPIHPVDNKPVRNNVSKAKSKAIDKMKSRMLLEDDSSPLDDVDISKLYTEKSDEDKTLIAEAIRASVMFQNITDAQREMIFGVMEPFKVKKGDWVIRQGTVGDRFYIVDSGSFEVRIVPEGQEDERKDGGNVVHVYHGSRTSHAHPSFGELALMYSAPRAASIIAQTNGQLWALHGSAFRKVLAEQTERKELCKVLRKVDAFKPTTKDDIKDLATHMEEGTYNRGDTIIQKGQLGDTFFIICQGGHCGK